MANLTLADVFRWDPFNELSRAPFQRYQGTSELAFVPDFEVRESAEKVVITADLPGMKAEELDISVHGNNLTVSGKRERAKQAEGERYTVLERTYGAFTRSFTLSEVVDQKGLEAELKDGVLTLTLPKVPEAKPQKITVRAK